MTMKITITNDDPGRTAKVTIYDYDKGEKRDQTGGRIGPGKSASFYIHAARSLLVDEVPEP